MKYEELFNMNTEVQIYEMDLLENIKGLYADGIIAINKAVKTTEKTCVLAEELGHYHTSFGDILNQEKEVNIKQEQRARNWAFNCLLPPEKFISAYHEGCVNRHEVAEFLEVTEEFLDKAIEHYRKRYGQYLSIEKYIIFFEPCLRIVNVLE